MSLPRPHLVLILLLMFVLGGCKVVEETTKLPMQGMRAVMPGGKAGPMDPVALQVAIQRYADEFTYQSASALDEYARRAGTEDARDQALSWKLAAASSSYSIASGPSPTANLLDFVCLASLTKAVLEEHWVKSPGGEAFQPWLDSSRQLETNVWQMAKEVFTPGQLTELHAAIRQWREDNPSARTAFFARPYEITQLIRKHIEKGNKTEEGGLLSFVGLDPTASLDPAVREVTRTRMFAERAMFTAQRAPSLLRWQVEVLTAQLLRGPQIAGVLTNFSSVTESVDRLSRATESASKTVAALPDRITAERQAVLAALETQEGRLRELAAEVGRTLGAADKMSTSLTTTLTTFDALMKRFGVGEPVTNAAPQNTNAPPFNILDYARTAERLTEMARELDTLIKDAGNTLDSPALTKRAQELGAVAARARDDAKSVLNHAFALAVALVVSAFLCALLYRRLGRSRAA